MKMGGMDDEQQTARKYLYDKFDICTRARNELNTVVKMLRDQWCTL